MAKSQEFGMDVFFMLLEVAQATSVPDPLLLAISYETIHVFLNNEIMRPQILARVTGRLRDSATLLPYIRGLTVQDIPNQKYHTLWRLCEIKYGSSKSSTRQRLMELVSDDVEPEDRDLWHDMVPEMRHLTNSLMIRVLLGIVKLIQLFSKEADNDPTGLLKGVTALLNASEREKLLVGPATGLVTCPDFDVKIECMVCIKQVIKSTPEQFDPEEMGWLLRFLTSTGMGVGKQEEFLIKVLEVIDIFIQNNSYSGILFRQRFGKYAIREVFEMLRVNSSRDTHGNEEEGEMRAALSRAITHLLQSCSSPIAGGLKAFLRRGDFTKSAIEVLRNEQELVPQNPDTSLLHTWTCRDLSQVLFPMVCGHSFDLHGVIRYQGMCCLADVLQGNPCRSTDVQHFDESNFWPGLSTLYKHLATHDETEADDTRLQQEYFVSSDGLANLLYSTDRYFACEEFSSTLLMTDSLMEGLKDDVELFLRQAWAGAQEANLIASPTGASSLQDQVQTAKGEAAPGKYIRDCFVARLYSLNASVGELYSCNLKLYSNEKDTFPMIELANLFEKFWMTEEGRHAEQLDDYDDAIGKIMKIPQQVEVQGVLQKVSDFQDRGAPLPKVRQPHRNLDKLLAEAREAHTAMKKALFAFSNPKAATWAKEIPDSDGLGYLGPDPQCATFGPGGLADFLREGEAKVIDHGVMSFREVQMCNEFKWHGRWDHLTSLSSLVIEYPDAEKLLDSYKKILLLTKLITIVSVKNHFLNPTSLGRHSIVLKVEHVFDDFVHISELKLVIAPGIEMQETFPTTVSHWSWLIRKGMKILREDLHLHPDDRCVQVMNFLCMRIESRCIHNGDTVFLRCDDVNLEMQLPGDGVFARSMVPTSHNLFLIERDAGAGVVRSGDTVRLRSKETQKLMEVDMTGRLRCRQVNLDPDEDDFLFAIELSSVKGHHIMADLGSAATALMAGFFSGGSDAVLDEGTKRQQGTNGPRFRGTIHQESKITLRALNQNAKLVTVRRPAANFLIAEEQKLRAVAAPEDKDKDNFRSTQEFVIFRDGSIRLGLGGCRRFFLQDGCLVVPEHDKTLTRQTLDGILQEAMIQAYMGAKLPTQDKCPNDGGVFRRGPPSVPPTFATMIWALSGKKQGGFSKASARSVAGSKLLVEMWALSAKHLSGMLRCAFSLLEVPQVAGCRQYVKRKFLEETYEQNATTMRLLTLVATVAQGLSSAANGGNPVPANELDINTAWLPAKTLRLVSSLLSHIDLVHAAEDPNIYTDFYQSSRSMTAEKQKQRDRLERDFAHADLGRLTFIGVTASYIERMVVPALLAMLGISGSRTMTLQEVCLTQAIYGNEMSNPSDKKSYASAITDGQPSGPPVVAEASGAQLQQPLAITGSPGARAAAGGPGAQVASAGVVATISDEASPPSPQNPTGSSTPSSPSQAPRKPKGNVSFALTDDARAKIVNKLFPGTTTKALVHALLYCIHEEAIAFRSGPRSSDVPVRFLTSLANKSISALAALMNMTGSTQQPESNDASATSREVSCDYHVCEAISQAMTMGRTLVPRARITQLMAERATDALRVAVQDIIDAGGFEAVSKTTYLTERVYTIAFGWAGVVIEGATQQSLSPRLLVITSRFRFAVLEFSAAARSSKAVFDRSDLTVLSCRDLQQLKAVICSPTMRQLLGFQWKKAADSRDQRDQQQVLIFESSARRGDFQRALRIIQRNEAASQKLRLGVPEVRLRQEVTLSLEDVCSPTRDRNPLVNVSFVHEASGQSKSLEVLLLTTITVSVMPLALFLDNYCRKDDFAHYDESNSSVAGLDTDSENEALPDAADDEELEEELKVMTGVRVPFELEDLQGVWFVAEASPKMKLQFSTDTLEFTFVSDGERQRFRRKLAQVLAGIDADGGKGDSKGIAKMPWTVVPTAYTSIGDVTKEAMSSSGALALTSGRS
ncbi:unnamed protein product [Polarella glacialis]|uniref:Calmodulin n=1 Tax=Polarella glacialis TaxID=89957 RepID=A0A813EWZ6_POLGL|nr:unnamed protein product [Polarella glacialis]